MSRLWIRRSCNSGRFIWSGRRRSSAPTGREVKIFDSINERVRRRTCVGASSGEGGDTGRGAPPALIRDDVMDLNHEFRCEDFWKPTKRGATVRYIREWGEEVRVAYVSGDPLFGVCPLADAFGRGGRGSGEANPRLFLLGPELQDLLAQTSLKGGTDGDNVPQRDALDSLRSPKFENGEGRR